MTDVFSSLAAPGEGLWAYTSGSADKRGYLTLLADIFTLLGQMHSEVIRVLNRTLREDSILEAQQMLRGLRADRLTAEFRTGELCDVLQQRGIQLRETGVFINSAWDDLTKVLQNREYATASLYEHELSPLLAPAMATSDISVLKGIVEQVSELILDQQAAFMVLARRALRELSL